jgi:hypothetical protein
MRANEGRKMGTVAKHPVKNQTFELLDDGNVRVEDLDEGTYGIFTRQGRHVDGDLGFADLQMLDWIGGRAIAPS